MHSFTKNVDSDKILQTTQLTSTQSNSVIFTNFCCEIYRECLNDYQHIILTHSRQLQSIHDQIINSKHYKSIIYLEIRR